MKLSSSAFKNNGDIPVRYTCDGPDVSPPLEINGAPVECRSLVLIVDDPDAPRGTWNHWIVFNIPPQIASIAEDSVPGTQGVNDFRKTDYGGPCPPSGTHRYFFKLFALDSHLDLPAGVTRGKLEQAMEGHILDSCELMGRYYRHN